MTAPYDFGSELTTSLLTNIAKAITFIVMLDNNIDYLPGVLDPDTGYIVKFKDAFKKLIIDQDFGDIVHKLFDRIFDILESRDLVPVKIMVEFDKSSHLYTNLVTIGSHPSNTIVIPMRFGGKLVSRLHAVLIYVLKQWWCIDFASGTGLRIGNVVSNPGKELAIKIIGNNTRIDINGYEIVFSGYNEELIPDVGISGD